MIRGFFITILTILLSLSLLTMIVSLDLAQSLKYDNIQKQIPALSPIINAQFNLTQQFNENLQIIKEYCVNNPDYVFSFQTYALHFPCIDINKSEITIVEDTLKNFVSDLYYKTYNCPYLSCVNQYSVPFLISEKSDSELYKTFYISLGISIAITIALFFLFKKKQDLPFLVGGLIVFTALPLLGISKIISNLQSSAVSAIVSLFLSQSNYVFLIMIIIGGVILLAGLIIELFRAGFKIYNMFSRNEQNKEIKTMSNKK